PRVLGLKLRLTHEPASERLGSSPARAWRTRALAASVRSAAISTMAGAVSGAVPPPVASRTAPAKDRRSGATVCALSEGVATTVSAMSRLLFCNAMEIEVDVSVEIAGNIEAFGHARRERLARHDGMHQRRHRELGRDGQVDRPAFAGLDTRFQHAG